MTDYRLNNAVTDDNRLSVRRCNMGVSLMSMMKATRGAISTCFLAAAMTIGFASYKAAISCSYRTAMGSVTETCGYVSDVGFMIVVNASSFVTALIVYLLYRKGVVAEGGIVQSPAHCSFNGYACEPRGGSERPSGGNPRRYSWRGVRFFNCIAVRGVDRYACPT